VETSEFEEKAFYKNLAKKLQNFDLQLFYSTEKNTHSRASFSLHTHLPISQKKISLN